MTVYEIIQKAQHLVESNCVTRISDESYDVKSSNDTPYLISNEICTCVGFKYRGECSHILAVKLHKSLTYKHIREQYS